MLSDFIFLGESKKAISIACPNCKNVKAVNKDLLDGITRFKEDYFCNCGFKSTFLDIGYLKQKIKRSEGISFGFIAVGLIVLVIGIISIATLTEDGGFQAFFGVGSIISGIILLILAFNFGKNLHKLIKQGESVLSSYIENENDEISSKCVGILNKKIKQYNLPDNKKVITITNKTKCFPNGKWYVWINNDNLNLFPKIELNSDRPEDLLRKVKSISVSSICLGEIEYYYTQGEIYRENKISGGGGGSSVKGAVVGGVIAGGAGAVIGSKKKVVEIKSELITHDTRETYLNFFDGNKVRKSIFLEYKDYQTLLDLIPQKDYNVVSAIKTSSLVQSVKNKEKAKTILDQIRELAKLKDEGILTEQEFSDKKKVLLDKM